MNMVYDSCTTGIFCPAIIRQQAVFKEEMVQFATIIHKLFYLLKASPKARPSKTFSFYMFESHSSSSNTHCHTHFTRITLKNG